VSSLVGWSQLHADTLMLADAVLDTAELHFSHGLAAGSDFTNVRSTACGSLLFSHATMIDTRLACDELLRLYAVNVFAGNLDGALQADDAYIQDVQIGLREASALDAWGSTLDRVSFCEEARDLRFGEKTDATCVDCADAPELQACRIDAEGPTIRDNACDLLEEVVAECERPWPPRERPQ
jgi:hypothetical protein